MVQVAQPDMGKVAFQELISRDIQIKGTLMANQEQAQQMLDHVAKHKIRVETNVFFGLEQVSKMVERSRSGTMKGKAVCIVI
jgi:D-arabinose 1-dehydrogenase-like Zn-dependent alcohol dehydrogenase